MDDVFSGDGVVALAMTVAVLRALDATPEQIDREQERVRKELFGDALATENRAAPAGISEDPDPPAAKEPETSQSSKGTTNAI